ncbi:MAG: ornithine cyclodeaminase family protein [Actinobacteria bacterium]|jgi:ornithine cyclodeaminase/alanine dehydrogenase-like protein (mu-crystallin family)|nr:ornithine cyclodeaminase family protein [Actinomycetota bacterium]
MPVLEEFAMLLLRNDDVRQVLDMPTTLRALQVGYADLAAGDAAYIPRIDLYAPTGNDDDYYRFGSMSGACRTYGVLATRLKSDIVSWPDGRTEEKHCVEPGTYSGMILLYATSNGEPLALIQDGYLQHMRVGGSAGIGVDVLARENAATLGLLGSGGMARSYLEAIAEVRSLEHVRVFSPTPAHRQHFAESAQRELGLSVTAVDSAEEAVRGADIVATATDAMGPTFDASWVSPGTHVTCVTRRELGKDLLALADPVVQLGVSTVPHGVAVPGMQWPRGSLAAYVAGRPDERRRIPAGRSTERGVYPSLVDLHLGRHPGRTSDRQITLFVTTGTQGLQFAAVGGITLQLARERGLGHPFPTEWFLEDVRN